MQPFGLLHFPAQAVNSVTVFQRDSNTSQNPTSSAWCAVAYAFPGLHPDGFDEPRSGWPRVLKRFAAEAWRRADAGELADEELYPCDAQWAALYDRMEPRADDETARRFQIAAAYGERADG
jgi:hypothetical protein